MKFELLPPSLREATIFKICATLWNYSIDLRRIMYCRNEDGSSETERGAAWLGIEDEVRAKIPELGLPQSLEPEVACFVKPIGVEILKWCEFHCFGSYLDIDMPKKFCWTSQGSIDLKKTAEILVKNANLSLTSRSKLALIYCLEDDILELFPVCNDIHCWESAHLHFQQLLPAEAESLLSFFNSGATRHLVPPDLIAPTRHVWAFIDAAYYGNITAVEYFCETLPLPKQQLSAISSVESVLLNYRIPNRIDGAFPKEFYPRVLCFLLSLLNAEQQMDVIKKHTSEILLCLVDWPYQNFVIEILKFISGSICPYTCLHLLNKILDKVLEGHEHCNYPGLFTDVWLNVAERCKQLLSKVACSFEPLVFKLLHAKDAGNIRLILKDLDPGIKKTILYFRRIRHWLATSNDSGLYEWLIRECIPLKADILEYKEKLTELKLPDASDQFVNLLDSLIREHDKRQCIEENFGNSRKKLASAKDEIGYNA